MKCVVIYRAVTQLRWSYLRQALSTSWQPHTRGITPNVYWSSEAWAYQRRLQLSGSDHVTGQRSMFDEYDWSRDSIDVARLWQWSIERRHFQWPWTTPSL